MASVSLEEKRLKQLKQQLFGKEEPVSFKTAQRKTDSSSTSAAALSSDHILLKQDLLKIITLSFLALLLQFSLYFANLYGLISLY